MLKLQVKSWIWAPVFLGAMQSVYAGEDYAPTPHEEDEILMLAVGPRAPGWWVDIRAVDGKACVYYFIPVPEKLQNSFTRQVKKLYRNGVFSNEKWDFQDKVIVIGGVNGCRFEWRNHFNEAPNLEIIPTDERKKIEQVTRRAWFDAQSSR